MSNEDELPDLWNKCGDRDAAIESWKNTDPNDTEAILKQILDVEFMKELVRQIAEEQLREQSPFWSGEKEK